MGTWMVDVMIPLLMGTWMVDVLMPLLMGTSIVDEKTEGVGVPAEKQSPCNSLASTRALNHDNRQQHWSITCPLPIYLLCLPLSLSLSLAAAGVQACSLLLAP